MAYAKQVGLMLAVMFVDGVNQMLIFPFVPFMVASMRGVSVTDPSVPFFSGVLGAVYLIGQFICSPFTGRVSDRIGRRPPLRSFGLRVLLIFYCTR